MAMNSPYDSNSKDPAKRVEGDLLHTGEQGEHHSHGLVHQPAAQEPLKDEDLALAGQNRIGEEFSRDRIAERANEVYVEVTV